MSDAAVSPQLDQIRAWEAGDLHPEHDTFSFGHGFGTALVEQFDRLRAESQKMRDALLRLKQWDMLTLDAEGHGSVTADAPWAHEVIGKALGDA